jgi:hypothetical protein
VGAWGTVWGYAASIAARVLICAGCLWGLSGCAIVKISKPDGTEETRILPLNAEAVRPANDVPQIIQVTTLGVSTASDRVDVGIRNEEIVVAPAKCHAVFVVRSEDQAKTAAKLGRGINRACVVRR